MGCVVTVATPVECQLCIAANDLMSCVPFCMSLCPCVLVIDGPSPDLGPSYTLSESHYL